MSLFNKNCITQYLAHSSTQGELAAIIILLLLLLLETDTIMLKALPERVNRSPLILGHPEFFLFLLSSQGNLCNLGQRPYVVCHFLLDSPPPLAYHFILIFFLGSHMKLSSIALGLVVMSLFVFGGGASSTKTMAQGPPLVCFGGGRKKGKYRKEKTLLYFKMLFSHTDAKW